MTNAISTQITVHKFAKPDCPPCRALGQTLAEYAEELAALGATVIEHDIAAEPHWIGEKHLASVPVLTFERNGIELGRIVGNVNPTEILETIEYVKEAK